MTSDVKTGGSSAGIAGWLSDLLRRSRSQLEADFSSAKQAELSFATWHGGTGVRDEDELYRILFAIHARFNGLACERHMWRVLVRELGTALPESIAADLIARRIAVGAIAHSKQRSRIAAKVATVSPDARRAYIGALYSSPDCDNESFAHEVASYSRDRQLLLSLARTQPSSLAKEALVYRMAHELGCAEEVRDLIESRHEALRARDPQLAEDGARRLLDTNDPSVHLALASNPATPTSLLHKLASKRNGKFARLIRAHANVEIARRLRQSPGGSH